jgi:dTDP-4-amino-4,6-dideoxygalactose transaminase
LAGRWVSSSWAWPAWPPRDERVGRTLSFAALAGRWAVSGPPSSLPSFLAAVAPRVAALAGRRHAVMTSSGSSAIVLALQALGIGPGSRVLVPALTWVGCATAILRTGARPVFLDAATNTPCVPSDLTDVELPPLDAVLAVHLYASQVDIAGLRGRFPGVPIIEDCSHCHGSVTPAGRRLGSLGDLSIFSFQATKILPAGEGGAVVTDDANMAMQLLSLATDSRRIMHEPGTGALNCLEPAGMLHGANHAMSEFSAAVLWEQMQRLPDLSARRALGLRLLTTGLDPSAGRLVFDETANVSGGFYGVPYRPMRPWPRDVSEIMGQIREECGACLDRVYPPVPQSPLYRPETVASYRHCAGALDGMARTTPNAVRWHEEALLLPHALFLADQPELTALSQALDRAATSIARPPVRSNRRLHELPSVNVVVLTTGVRDSLADALRSVVAQDYAGPYSVLLVCDDRYEAGARVSGLVETVAGLDRLIVRRVSLVEEAQSLPTDPYARVAILRRLALSLVSATLVAFLDDDNAWEPEHLSSLVHLMGETGSPAVHSWRRLYTSSGEPHVPASFPWMQDQSAAKAKLRQSRNEPFA